MINIKYLLILYYYLIFWLLNGLLLYLPISILNIFFPNLGFFYKNINQSSFSFFIKFIIKVDIYVNSNSIINNIYDSNTQNILILNHISDIDNIVVSLLNNSIKSLHNFKWIGLAKKDLAYMLPGITITSLLSRDIYLNRNIILDNKKLIKKNNSNLLIMFPEGARFSIDKKKISDIYCKKNNLITFKYHLYPRITGIQTLIKNHPKYKKIFDATIIFDTIPKELYEKSDNNSIFLSDNFPNKIFININKYNIPKLKYFDKYMESIYLNKDKFINDFDIHSNKFKPLKYNYIKGGMCFLILSFLNFISTYLLFNYKFIRTLYFCELVFIYFYVFFNF